jgi:hypothetical protein
VAAAAAEPPRRGAPGVETLRIEGHFGPPGSRTPAADLTLDLGGVQRRFQVERVVVLRGERLGSDVLAAATPYRPSFYVRGPRPLLDRLAAVPDGTPVAITAYRHGGPRELLASRVDVTGPHGD